MPRLPLRKRKKEKIKEGRKEEASPSLTLALRMICLARASEPRGSLHGWQMVGSSCVSRIERASPSLRSVPKFFTRFLDDDCVESSLAVEQILTEDQTELSVREKA